MRKSDLLNPSKPNGLAYGIGFLLAHITVGDLGAEDTGDNETQGCANSEHDNILVTSPAERVSCPHQIDKSVKGECSQNKEQGDKHRRKKYINHNNLMFLM
jgi:hypothetical protein